jgi:hypothetical protein
VDEGGFGWKYHGGEDNISMGILVISKFEAFD